MSQPMTEPRKPPARGLLTTAAERARALAARPLETGFLTDQQRREIIEARAVVRRFYGS